MSVQLVAFYGEPENKEEFEKNYFEGHLPLAAKMPGLQDVKVVRFEKNLMGGNPPYYMMATMTFDSMDALNAAMGSDEGKAAGANVMGFAGKIITMTTAEVCQVPAAV